MVEAIFLLNEFLEVNFSIFIHLVNFYTFYVIFYHSYFIRTFRIFDEKTGKKIVKKHGAKNKSKKHV